MNNDFISIVIPCFNVEKYIEECLVAVSNQTNSNYEIIAVDNNSTDSTMSVLQELKLNSFPEMIIVEETKKGACAARNKGLKLAKGDWIQFLDADDLLKPEKLSRQLDLINKASKEISFLVGACEKRNLNNEVYKTEVPNVDDPYLSIFVRQAGITSSNLWNKEALIRVNGWNEELKSSQEADLMLRLMLNKGEVIASLYPDTIIRERESGQISQSDPTNRLKRYLEVRMNYLKELKAKESSIYDSYKDMYYTFLVSSLIMLSSYSKAEALKMLKGVQMFKAELKEAYGISKKHILLTKVFGIKVLLRGK